MNLTMFNGSTRGLNSNSKLLSDSFLKVFSLSLSDEIEEYFLKDKKIGFIIHSGFTETVIKAGSESLDKFYNLCFEKILWNIKFYFIFE